MEPDVLKDLYLKAAQQGSVTVTLPAHTAINAHNALQHQAGGADLIDAAAWKGSLDDFDIAVERGTDLKTFLDDSIRAWGDKRKQTQMSKEDFIEARAYEKAFQTVRQIVFGKVLEEDK